MDLMIQKYRFGKKRYIKQINDIQSNRKKGGILPFSSLLTIFGKTE